MFRQYDDKADYERCMKLLLTPQWEQLPVNEYTDDKHTGMFWDYCRNGNLTGIQHLLRNSKSSKELSPRLKNHIMSFLCLWGRLECATYAAVALGITAESFTPGKLWTDSICTALECNRVSVVEWLFTTYGMQMVLQCDRLKTRELYEKKKSTNTHKV